jgi:HD-GYP domain-containing protein (c-di-GMP phosphodiesterase class II)
MAVADAFSAMTTDRPYRKGMEIPEAIAELRKGRGTQWDPKLVDAFLRARDRKEEQERQSALSSASPFTPSLASLSASRS